MSELTERKTIAINDVDYYLDTVTEQGRKLINSIQRVEGIIETHQIEAQIAQMAKSKFFDDLIRETTQFEKVNKS